MQVVSINNVYSSASRRLMAWFIDYLLISAVTSFVFNWNFDGMEDWWNISLFSWHIGYITMCNFIMITLYKATMEASKYQGSFGKIAVGIKVTGIEGERLSFSKALLRNVAKTISWLVFCIGYIMIIFDDRKQGLHDKIADAYVVRT
jgi:uncharacterized RDD family membrane protein YckC